MTRRPQWQVSAVRLRQRRLVTFQSQRELATRSQVSIQRIKQLELADSGIRPETARKLAKALRCRVSDFVEPVEESA